MSQPERRKPAYLRLSLALLALLLAGMLAEQMAQYVVARRYPPPGRLVDVGGRRLHLHCLGSGDITVVLEAGLGSDSTAWYAVQPQLAEVTRVCAYDRAGYGWSDPLRGDRTAGRLVADLHLLLDNSDTPGPFVLVGHSLGGLLIRLYQETYPDEVLGVVLVDSSHESAPQRQAELGLPPSSPYGFKDVLGVVFSYVGGTRLILKKVEPYGNDVPPVIAREMAALKAKPRSMAAQFSEMRHLHDYYAEAAAYEGSLRHVPLMVLAALGDRGDHEQQFWLGLQEELAARSALSELRQAHEGRHHLHWAEPAMVVAAIRDLIKRLPVQP